MQKKRDIKDRERVVLIIFVTNSLRNWEISKENCRGFKLHFILPFWKNLFSPYLLLVTEFSVRKLPFRISLKYPVRFPFFHSFAREIEVSFLPISFFPLRRQTFVCYACCCCLFDSERAGCGVESFAERTGKIEKTVSGLYTPLVYHRDCLVNIICRGSAAATLRWLFLRLSNLSLYYCLSSPFTSISFREFVVIFPIHISRENARNADVLHLKILNTTQSYLNPPSFGAFCINWVAFISSVARAFLESPRPQF